MIQKIVTLEFSLNGSPFCKIATGDTEANTLEYSLNGSPWWGIGGYSGGVAPVITGNIKRILKVDWANVKTANKVIGH